MSRHLTSSMLIALTCLALAGCNQDRAVAVRSMNKGLTENKTGRTGDAVKLLEEATQADKTYADPPYYLGQIYHQKYNQLEKAEAAFRKALERDKENAQFHYRLGSILAKRKKHAEAVGHFKKATAKEKSFAKAWFRMGLSQRAEGKYSEAVESFSQAIKADPTMRIGKTDPGGAAFHALGDIYIVFRFYDKALGVYEEGLKHNAGLAQLLRGKGLAQVKLKQFGPAEATLQQALKADPSKAQAYFNLAVAQHAQGRTKQAIKTVDLFLSRADPIRDGARMGAASGLRAELKASMEKK